MRVFTFSRSRWGRATLPTAAPSAQRGAGVPLVRTVHVSVVDRNQAPVTGLAATEFVLKEGGDTREIIKVEPATTPMHVAIIVDDSGTGIFRVPVANFVNQLLGRAQFAIKHVIGQAVRLVDYTSDVEQLRAAVLEAGRRGETPEGGRVVEAVFDTSKEQHGFERPVIIVLTDTYSEPSSLPAQHVLDELQQERCLLYVVSIVKRPASSAIVPSTPAAKESPRIYSTTSSTSTACSAMAPDRPEGVVSRSVVLADRFPSFKEWLPS